VDSQQAKQILGRYRPGVDDDDPQFAEALAFARRTPELSRWLDQQVALDAAIRAKLRSAAAPVGLKTRILANAKVEPPAIAWWRHPGWIAVALAALIVVAMVWHRTAGFPAYRAKMVAFVSREYKLDLKTKSFEEFRQALAKGKYPAISALPPALAKVTLEGGCLLDWRGHKVTLICMEAPGQGDVWLCLAERGTVPETVRQVGKVGKMMTAAWTDGNLVYLLITEGDEAELRRYL